MRSLRSRVPVPDTNSTSTPATLSGCMNATRRPNSPDARLARRSAPPPPAGRPRALPRCRPRGRRRGACPGPRFSRNRPTGVSAPRAPKKLDPRAADAHRDGLHALLRHRLAMLHRCPEQPLVGAHGGVQVVNSVTDMMDEPGLHGPGIVGDARDEEVQVSFFDKLKEQAIDVATTVADKTQETAKTGQLQMQLRSLKGEESDALTEFGRAAYAPARAERAGRALRRAGRGRSQDRRSPPADRREGGRDRRPPRARPRRRRTPTDEPVETRAEELPAHPASRPAQ